MKKALAINGQCLHLGVGALAFETNYVQSIPNLNCAGGTQPSMVLSVSGHVSPINWCGLTWTVGEQGTQKEVCPTTYTKQNKLSPTLYSGACLGTEFWEFPKTGTTGTGYDDLRINAHAFSYCSNNLMMNSFSIQLQDNIDLKRWYNVPYNATDFTFAPASSLNNIGFLTSDMVNPVTKMNYRIPNTLFGSATISGVTYTWSKGTNWN